MTTMGANLLGIGHLAGTESRAAFDGFDGSTYVDVANDLESAFISVSEVVNPTVVQIQSERVTTREVPGCTFGYPFACKSFETCFGSSEGGVCEFRREGLCCCVIVSGVGE